MPATATTDAATKSEPARKRRDPGFVLPRAEALVAEVLRETEGQRPDQPGARAKLLEVCKRTLAEARDETEVELLRDRNGMRCAQNLSAVQDEIIAAIFRFATEQAFRRDNPSASELLSIAAVGGYGRGTLAPGSDIDLLFILPYKQTPWGEQVTEFILYLLWDLGQKVGHAVRSVNECIQMSKTDMTVRTATLEARHLAGDQTLFDDLMTRFDKEVMTGTGPEFIAAKLAERDARHEAIGNTRYVVEPNVKEGKGGLRDLNTLFWIFKYFYKVQSAKELVERGVFSRQEMRTFENAEKFLWTVRCNLHFLTGRAEEKLHFDLQPSMAHRLGYSERAGMLSVERFMKRYFLVAKDVGDLTRIICASLEFAHAKQPRMLERVFGQFNKPNRKIKGETDFKVDRGRINVTRDDVFARDPVNMIKIFWVAAREDLMFHPDALKLITRSLGLIRADVRNDERANAYFLEILTNPATVERVLRRMNESGVLGRFVTEFGKIVALVQFNMYHHFTVDEHLIRAVGVMAAIERGELKDELPLTHELLPRLSGTKLLNVALFLHDIAKGQPEDHSIAGEKVARRLCPRFGLSESETDTVAWLIRYHLTMSEIAQSRDIQDPETARTFADIVQSPNRLALLMILTACDIMAVGPGVWTGWKGSLLRALYYATEPLLSGGHTQLSQNERIAAIRLRLADALTDWNPAEIEAYLDRHFDPYFLRTDPDVLVKHAKMIRKADAAGLSFVGQCDPRAFESITEVSFYTSDHPRLLSIIAAACTMCEASIAGAHISSTRDGWALDTFHLKRAFAVDEDERIRATRIIETVRELLSGSKYIPKNLGRDSRLNRRLKPFKVPPDVQISNALSKKFTVIEVNGLDRTGLLHDLTQVIADLNLSIASAHISTFGEKAVDVFYVTDLTGGKVTSAPRQKRIIDRLLAVFEPQTDKE
ncbi:MAG: [protein-PII] uridylyltransferase [Hyphomicrobiaceae bacterium]|nr:[protein-PII] uridylyltransferase [Hyphomicrobiaceae bacterium]